jgi:hypothetical protein
MIVKFTIFKRLRKSEEFQVTQLLHLPNSAGISPWDFRLSGWSKSTMRGQGFSGLESVSGFLMD